MLFQNLIFQERVEDSEYLKDQRAKIGPKGSFQLGPVDKTTIQKPQKRVVEGERQKQIYPYPIASTSYDQDVILSQSSNSDEIYDAYEPARHSQGVYSLLKIPPYATELMRGDCSSNLGASLANDFLLDLHGPSQPKC